VRHEGHSIRYGDATREDVLRLVGLERARVLVVTIPDPGGCRQIVAVARRANPALRIIARTRYLAEVDELHRLGADEVVPEEFQTSLELAGFVMAAYGADEQAIAEEKTAIREARYSPLRGERRQDQPTGTDSPP
jgi:CPA2 family monovalent cation:H+ antiporter-2